MANETEFANFQTATYIAGSVIPYFEATIIGRGWTQEQIVQDETKSYNFKLLGNLTASAVTESNNATASEYTETSVTVTASKVKVYTELTEESQVYIGSRTLDLMIEKAGMALAQKYDTDFLDNASNFATAVGSSTNALTTDYLLQATYELDADDAQGMRAFFLHQKQLFEIADEIKDATGRGLDKSYSGLLSRNANPNAVRGSIFDIPIYASNLVEDDATDYFGMLITDMALGSVIANGGLPLVKIAEGVQKGVTEIGVSSFYGFGELKDVAGVKLQSGV